MCSSHHPIIGLFGRWMCYTYFAKQWNNFELNSVTFCAWHRSHNKDLSLEGISRWTEPVIYFRIHTRCDKRRINCVWRYLGEVYLSPAVDCACAIQIWLKIQVVQWRHYQYIRHVWHICMVIIAFFDI